jgi:hypothetical protein
VPKPRQWFRSSGAERTEQPAPSGAELEMGAAAGGESLAKMDSPFYFYAAAFVIWLGVSIGVLELITRLSNTPTKKPEAKAE